MRAGTTLPGPQQPRLIRAETVQAALAAQRDGATYLAGGSWLMRNPLRGQPLAGAFVALDRIPELSRVAVSSGAVVIGAAVSHAALARAVTGLAGLEALAEAAGQAANPAVRQVATVGGNLCTPDFPAADLVPALLALEAEVEIAGANGAETLPLAAFLARRHSLLPAALLTRIRIPRKASRSAHIRLPLRRAGDYPVAVLSMAQAPDPDGTLQLRIAVGSVEAVARRWTTLEQALAGAQPDPDSAARAAARCLDDFRPRDGIEAAGWYRLQVLPVLVRRALTSLLTQDHPA
jgi:carbon-monoxide dehydrogenase medium subunit